MAAAVASTFQALLDSEDGEDHLNAIDEYESDDGGGLGGQGRYSIHQSSSYEDENDDDGYGLLRNDKKIEARQGILCRELLQKLLDSSSDSSARQASSSSSNNIREILGSQSISDVTPILANLLSTRVETAELLPATQDAEANEEVMRDETSAQTLTLVTMNAACLYAKLLTLPGAYGAGLVDLEALTALNAVIRRWTIECCGREDEVSENYSTASASSNSRKSKASSKQRKSQSRQQSPSKSPPKKKSRRRAPESPSDSVGLVVMEDSDDDDEGFGSPRLLQLGLQVALYVCEIPCQVEFSSWNSEAREVVLDAVMTSFGTSAALGGKINKMCPQVVEQASKAMQSCVSEESSTNRTQKHETSVVLLRGLLNLLQFKEIVPNGERGKTDAHAAASQALLGLIENVSSSSVRFAAGTTSGRGSGLTDSGNAQSTPSRHGRRRSSGGGTTPGTVGGKTPGTVGGGKTPKSQRKKRRSSFGMTPITSPVLKGRRQANVNATANAPGGPQMLHPILKIFIGMLQKLACSPGLERAVARGPTVETINKSLAKLPAKERAHFLRYLLKLSNSKISMHRLVASEVIGSILQQDWLPTHNEESAGIGVAASGGGNDLASPVSTAAGTPASTTSSMKGDLTLPAALWKALQGRLTDKIAAVRARAATSLGESAKVHVDNIDERLLNCLRRRALKDETATVRKASALAITQVLLVQKDLMSESYLAAMCDLCHDSSLLTRKGAAESLTKLLKEYVDHPLGSMMEEAWTNCVLPMVLDEESGSKASAAVDDIVLQPILDNNGEVNNAASRQAVAWRILAHVGSSSGQQGGSKGGKLALQSTLKQLAVEDYGRIHNLLLERVTRVACKSLDDESSESQVVGSWCLFEALLSQSKDIDEMVDTIKDTSEGIDFCVNAWKTILNKQSMGTAAWLPCTLRSCLIVLSKLASGLNDDVAADCRMSLLEELERFAMAPDVIGSVVEALVAVSSVSQNRVESRTICKVWIRSLFSNCETALESFVREVSEEMEYDVSVTPDQERTIVRALFTVGELSMVGFRADDDEGDVRRQDDDKTSDFLRGLSEKPSALLRELVQTMLASQLVGSGKTENPISIRAHAFTVMGKLCLRDEKLAKSSLNLFARELSPSLANPCPSVQSNALLVLGDLCVRYTNMADRYLPIMASCLQAGSSDPETNLMMAVNRNVGSSAIVRKHAVLLLSSLLLQDYIKWRGLLFHRFLVACSDDDESVAQLAETVLSGPLWQRHPKLFFNHFVESLFVLNKCTAHPIYVAATTHGDGGSGIAVGFDGIKLNGTVGMYRRRKMYDFLLSKLTDEDKIGVTARLSKEVLGSAANSEGDLGQVCEMSAHQVEAPHLDSAWNVLTDAFYILTSKAIKVGKVGSENGDDFNIEDPNIMANPSRQVSVAKSRLMSKISRKHLIEIVLPILCNLKTKLQTSCSPLLKDLTRYLLDIYKNYKVEVKEFLANDPTLLQEIEYDARQESGGSSSSSSLGGGEEATQDS